MSDFKHLARRYQEDATFHHMVSALYGFIDQLQLSPSEIREAAMFAVYLHEMENPRPIMVGPVDPREGF